jgi:uncharacterized UBP type Zn finger protein
MQKSEKANNLDDITKMFSMGFTTKLNCQTCNSYKIRDQKVNQVKLPCPYIKQQTDAEEYQVDFNSISHSYTQPEIVSGVYCSNCNRNTDFVKKYSVKKFPKYFVMPVTRFALENWVPVKIQAYIQVPKGEVDFSNFLFKEPGPLEQRLKGMYEIKLLYSNYDKFYLNFLLY